MEVLSHSLRKVVRNLLVFVLAGCNLNFKECGGGHKVWCGVRLEKGERKTFFDRNSLEEYKILMCNVTCIYHDALM